MATVRDGIYLEDKPPARSQYRVGRRDPVRSVIVVHTAESGTDRTGPDSKAENVAGFIQRRTDAGSYHLLGDSDSIIQLVDFANEALGDRTGSNRWAIHISLAMNATDWTTLTAARRDQLVDTAGQMAAIAARWLEARGLAVPAGRLLTKADSDRADASGFISHARRDPGRRYDPGAGFPWSSFFAAYERHLERTPMRPTTTTERNELVVKLQESLAAAEYEPGPIDGIYGPQTHAAAIEALEEGDQNLKALAADQMAAAYRNLMEATS